MVTSMPAQSLSPAMRATRQTGACLSQAFFKLTFALGRSPEPREVSDAMGLSIDEYRAALRSVAPDHRDCPELFGVSAVDCQRALESLPPAAQSVLPLRHVEDCSFMEIGQVLGMSEEEAAETFTEAKHLLGAAVAARRSSRPPMMELAEEPTGYDDDDPEPPLAA